MSTSSIYNNIKVTDKKFCRSLVSAMEKAKEDSGKKVVVSKKVQDLNCREIRKIFGESK